MTACRRWKNRRRSSASTAAELHFLAWRTFLWRTAGVKGVVATLHRPARLPTLVECRTDPALLARIIAELCPEDAGDIGVIHQLYEKHQGNIRLALREMYDRHATT